MALSAFEEFEARVQIDSRRAIAHAGPYDADERVEADHSHVKRKRARCEPSGVPICPETPLLFFSFPAECAEEGNFQEQSIDFCEAGKPPPVDPVCREHALRHTDFICSGLASHPFSFSQTSMAVCNRCRTRSGSLAIRGTMRPGSTLDQE